MAIDARKAGDTGVGRYLEGLLGGIARHPRASRFSWDVYAQPSSRPLLAGLAPVGSLRCAPWGVYSPLQHPAFWLRLRRAPPDVLHAPHFTAPLLVPAGTRLLVTIHDVAFLERPDLVPRERAQRWRLIAYRLALRLAAGRADLVCADTAAAGAEVARHVPEARGKVRVLSPGMDTAWGAVPEGARSGEAPGEGGGPSGTAGGGAGGARDADRDVILFVGTVTERKGVHVLLDAYARSASRGRLRLVIAGPADSAYARRMMDRAAALGIADRVAFPGAVTDGRVRDLVGRARMVVLPSFLEGFGLPVLEAMLAGVPCVASRLPAIEEVAGDAALLVPSGDVTVLAAGIDRVCADGELARDLVARGRERARRFSTSRMAEGAMALYAELAG